MIDYSFHKEESGKEMVHFSITTDDEDLKKKISSILLEALYKYGDVDECKDGTNNISYSSETKSEQTF